MQGWVVETKSDLVILTGVTRDTTHGSQSLEVLLPLLA